MWKERLMRYVSICNEIKLDVGRKALEVCKHLMR